MPTELEQRARELLAAEYERQGSRGFAEALRSGGDAGTDVFYLRAITAALQAQQPGAQAVAFRFRHEGPWSRWLEMNELHHYDRNGSLVNGPAPAWEVEYAYLGQPPSIPEPSDEDIDGALTVAFGEKATTGEAEADRHWRDLVRDILTTDRARLRERGGK